MEIRASLPRTPVGKLSKKELMAEEIAKRQASDGLPANAPKSPEGVPVGCKIETPTRKVSLMHYDEAQFANLLVTRSYLVIFQIVAGFKVGRCKHIA